jgi:hypothetical protein
MECQTSDEERRNLQRSQYDLAYLCATKKEGGKGSISTHLTRGQFIEIVLRLVQQRYPKHKISEKLDAFLDSYLRPHFLKSAVLSIRQEIRESKQLNQLLFDNKAGLTEIFLSYHSVPGGFNL